jgi:hypothetical protein
MGYAAPLERYSNPTDAIWAIKRAQGVDTRIHRIAFADLARLGVSRRDRGGRPPSPIQGPRIATTLCAYKAVALVDETPVFGRVAKSGNEDGSRRAASIVIPRLLRLRTAAASARSFCLG